MKITVIVDPDTCIGCGECEEGCPVDVFEIDDDKSCVVHMEQCGFCQWCETVCPTEAVKVECKIDRG